MLSWSIFGSDAPPAMREEHHCNVTTLLSQNRYRRVVVCGVSLCIDVFVPSREKLYYTGILPLAKFGSLFFIDIFLCVDLVKRYFSGLPAIGKRGFVWVLR